MSRLLFTINDDLLGESGLEENEAFMVARVKAARFVTTETLYNYCVVLIDWSAHTFKTILVYEFKKQQFLNLFRYLHSKSLYLILKQMKQFCSNATGVICECHRHQ